MTKLPFTRTHLSLAAGALLLAACGGGDPMPTDPVAGTQVPASATTSSAGAFTFVRDTAGTSDNSAEPLVVGDATLATSETDEPDPGV